MTIRIVLADDQALIRAGFAALIGSAEDMVVVGEAVDGQAAVERAKELHPNVILMDIRMPGTDGLSATEAITSDPTLSDVRILVLTTFEADEYVLSAIRAGASGFLGKGVEPDDFLAAIRVVANGDALLSPVATKALIGRYLSAPELGAPNSVAGNFAVLTDRERELVAFAAQGWSNEQIATNLVVSPLTVKTHINRAMTKLGARDRAQLVVMAYQAGLVRVGPVQSA